MNATACAPCDVNLKMGRFEFNFKALKANVKKLQVRIVKAKQTGRHNKVKALQWLLTHSISAKILAVKRVTENKGRNTPGIDNIIWKTDKQKCEAVGELRRRGYFAEPLRRVFIPKKNGKKRPLEYRRSARIAQKLNPLLGSLIITHPFHPLKEQCYEILKVKEVNGIRLYSLRTDSGVIKDKVTAISLPLL